MSSATYKSVNLKQLETWLFKYTSASGFKAQTSRLTVTASDSIPGPLGLRRGGCRRGLGGCCGVGGSWGGAGSCSGCGWVRSPGAVAAVEAVGSAGAAALVFLENQLFFFGAAST